MLEKLLQKTDLSMEQKTAVRGQIRILKEDFVEKLKSLAFIMPLVFSLHFYFLSDLDKAIFWALLALLGYKIWKTK